MTIFRFVFKRYFSKLSNSILVFLLPIAVAFLPMGGFPEWMPLPLGFQYYGVVLLLISARLGRIIIEDRINKTLLRVGVAPITHGMYLTQNLMAYSLILTLVNIIFIAIGILVHGENLINPIMLFAVYSIFSTTAIGFSLAWHVLFRNKEAAFSLLGIVIMLMSMLGGVMWPVIIMPEILQRFAMLLPTYWLMEALILITRNAPISDILLSSTMMIMFSTLFILLGSRRSMV